MGLTLKMDGESPLVPVMMQCHNTTIRVTVEIDGVQTPFYVSRFDYERHTCCCGGQQEWSGTARLQPGNPPWWD
jgi:hypothetical protein